MHLLNPYLFYAHGTSLGGAGAAELDLTHDLLGALGAQVRASEVLPALSFSKMTLAFLEFVLFKSAPEPPSRDPRPWHMAPRRAAPRPRPRPAALDARGLQGAICHAAQALLARPRGV